MFASKDALFTAPSGYTIARSVRLRSSASAYLSRTPASAGNSQKWTWSAWVKLGGTAGYYLYGVQQSGAADDSFYFDSTTRSLGLSVNNGAIAYAANTNAVFRDPSAWYHVLIAVDTTQAVAANRVQFYVNGAVQSQASNSIPQNYVFTGINTTRAQNIGRHPVNGIYFDGYMTEMFFIDGQQLTPSSFGQTDTITGVWTPKKYTGTYGTNGFYLNFSDNSALTTASNAGIGKDFSGNGNYWVTNNISLTAGATYDSMIDVPTPYADGGNGRGNYCVLNPLVSTDGSLTYSDGNLTVVGGSASIGTGSTMGTISVSSGKWYYEVTVNALDNRVGCGIVQPTNLGIARDYFWNYFDQLYYAGASSSSYGSRPTAGQVVGCAFDLDSGTITWYINNVSQGQKTGLTTGVLYSPYAELGLPAPSNESQTWNFGQRPFSYTPPSGYVALNTYNLPASTISNGATVMAATTYTGNGTTQTLTNAVNGVSMKPDMVWVKDRSSARSHILSDSVRGTSYSLYPNETTAEATNTDRITAFNSNGFSVGTGLGVNASTETFVAWQWQAGQGTTSSNTSGSITSTVSVNATAGFSIVTYTGNQTAGATVGHGLGVAPNLIIVKSRGAVTSWPVYHSALGATNWILLNSASAQQTTSQEWNNTAPTSTVFSIGNSSANSNQVATYVAYCWSAVKGFSAFGSYTGNGSTDGPFVYTGFRPRWVMMKCSSSAGLDWNIVDTSRNTSNVTTSRLWADLSNAEDSSDNVCDITSNGFKLRSTNTNTNSSGATFIYVAFAEVPQKFALAR